MSVVAPTIMDFGRIVLNFYFLFFIASIAKTKGVDISFFGVIIPNIFLRRAEYRLLPSGAFKRGMVGFQPSAGFIHSAKFEKDNLQSGYDQQGLARRN